MCFTDFSVYEGGDIFPLIHAFNTVVQKHGEIRLIVAGSDEYGYAKKIQKYINNSHLQRHILLRPNMSETAQSLLLSAADIFISPSDTIHRNNQAKILTAMSQRLPVIATEDDENGVIEHNKNGLKLNRICKPSSYDSLDNYLPLVSEEVKRLILSQGIVVDTEQMVKFLILLVEDQDLRQALGNTAYDYVAANHGWSRIIVERYVGLWNRLREKMTPKPSPKIISENLVDDNESQLADAHIRDLPFFSFMSQNVGNNTDLQLTSSGETLLETKQLISYDAMKDIIYPLVVFEILHMAKYVVNLSEIISCLLSKVDGDDADGLVPNITYHVMWCIKQGFIIQSH